MKASSTHFIIHNRGFTNLKNITVKSMEESNRKMTNVMTLSKESCTPALTMPCDPRRKAPPRKEDEKVKSFEYATLHLEVFPLHFLKIFRLVSSLLIHPSFKLSVRRKTILYFKGMQHYEKENVPWKSFVLDMQPVSQISTFHLLNCVTQEQCIHGNNGKQLSALVGLALL